MTLDQLAKIESRADAASINLGDSWCDIDGRTRDLGDVFDQVDCWFIAHARSDVSELVAEVRRLNVALHDAKQQLARATSPTPKPDPPHAPA